MSFSADVKKELAEALPDKICCRTAECYGLLEFGHAFRAGEISLQTEQETIAELYTYLTTRICQVPAPAAETIRRRARLYVRSFPQAQDREKILARFGHGTNEVSLRLNRANLDCDGCVRALLQGAFLACGAVTDPACDYHLEFSVPHYNLSRDLLSLLGEAGFPVKTVIRSGSYILYMKESERIEDCLTYLGASRAALEMMNVKMVKSIRNETNRRFNCENANIDKTVAAAGVQTEALERICRSGGLSLLPEELRPLARLRLDNPDMSLRELGEALDPPLTRSGVNHRMQKILAFAAGLPEADPSKKSHTSV